MSWNLIIQANYWNRANGSCLMATIPGLSQPAQIHVVSCGSSTDSLTRAVTDWITTHLGQSTTNSCGGPGSGGGDGGLACQAYSEPACRHVLVLLKSAGVPIDAAIQSLVTRWTVQAGPNGYVVIALPHGEGSADLPLRLRQYHRLFHPAPEFELGLSILRSAGIGSRQKLFLSYRRQDTKELGDQIHQGLTRRGFHVYLDRFSWTPGRLFPEEIAEELAERGTVLLLESSGLHLSRWTQWELAFARMYHLGILAINVNASPYERGIEWGNRHRVSTKSSGELSNPDLKNALDFIVRRYSIAEARRRVYFEALVRRAALNAGGTIKVRSDGLFEVDGNGHRGLVLPSGRPANLVDLSALGRACSLLQPAGPTSILIGQHEHLPPDMRQDVNWLAQDVKIAMTGTANVFTSIQNLFQRGRP